jgi:hypothetical protein
LVIIPSQSLFLLSKIIHFYFCLLI